MLRCPAGCRAFGQMSSGSSSQTRERLQVRDRRGAACLGAGIRCMKEPGSATAAHKMLAKIETAFFPQLKKTNGKDADRTSPSILPPSSFYFQSPTTAQQTCCNNQSSPSPSHPSRSTKQIDILKLPIPSEELLSKEL